MLCYLNAKIFFIRFFFSLLLLSCVVVLLPCGRPANPFIHHKKNLNRRSELCADGNVNLKAELDKLASKLKSEQLQNELISRQLGEFQLQSELSTSKINVI